MSEPQAGILAPPPRHARYLTFALRPGADPKGALEALAAHEWGQSAVLGIGLSTTLGMKKAIPGLRTFPEHAGAGVEVPSTPGALWIWLRGDDRGELLHQGRTFEALLVESYELRHVIDGFQFGASRDLTGYEDGTENPEGDKAVAATFVASADERLNGSSFVAVQQWEHDLDAFLSLEPSEQDDVFGRRKADNEEFDEAPESAHAKRAAQESYSPEAFLTRRSLPWSEGDRQGLMFVAFGKSFDAFEAILSRMVGEEDGIVDALFSFSRPLSGSFFWCPPVSGGRLDLSALLA